MVKFLKFFRGVQAPIQTLIDKISEDPVQLSFIVFNLWRAGDLKTIGKITRPFRMDKTTVLELFGRHFNAMRLFDFPEEEYAVFLTDVLPIFVEYSLHLAEDDSWHNSEVAAKEVILRGRVLVLNMKFEEQMKPWEEQQEKLKMEEQLREIISRDPEMVRIAA